VASVEIYSKSWCGYCNRAKKMLEMKKVDYVDHDIEQEPGMRAEMIQRAGGRTTVPQIFIDGKHVGGCNDLFALEMDGKLDALLAA
jgi:glutaredoxin 3